MLFEIRAEKKACAGLITLHLDCVFSFFGDFGFGFGTQQHHEREIPRGGDVMMDLDITLEELYVGNFIEVHVLDMLLCSAESGRFFCHLAHILSHE